MRASIEGEFVVHLCSWYFILFSLMAYSLFIIRGATRKTRCSVNLRSFFGLPFNFKVIISVLLSLNNFLLSGVPLMMSLIYYLSR